MVGTVLNITCECRMRVVLAGGIEWDGDNGNGGWKLFEMFLYV